MTKRDVGKRPVPPCPERGQIVIADGLTREVVAVTLDRAELKCRPDCLRDNLLGMAAEIVATCLDRRKDLSDDQRGGLGRMLNVLRRAPEVAFREMVAFRRSFVAPIPGQLGERIGPL